MPSGEPDLPKSEHHIWLYKEDWEFLSKKFGKGGDRPISVGVAIRLIVHQRVKQIRARAQDLADQKGE